MSMGRGLDSFFKDAQQVQTILENKEEAGKTLKVSQIKANPDQARKVFKEEDLKALAQSIEDHGILQPLLVRKVKDHYQIIAGERRFRAAKLAGLKEVPVLIKDLFEEDAATVSLIENIQREDLNPIEEALAFQEMMKTYQLTQEDLAKALSKSRSSIANILRLLKLEEEVQDYLREGKLSFSHGRLLLKIKDPKAQVKKAREIVAQGTSILEAEKSLEKTKNKKKSARKDPYLQDIEDRLSLSLGTKVEVMNRGKVKKIQIEYYSDEDLTRLLEEITGENIDGI